MRDGTWRWDTALRIRKEGRQAYLDGKPESSCPYSRGFWGFGGAWDQGYLEAKLEAEAQQLCQHEWIGQRQGGDPADASSNEWVVFCRLCGTEKPAEDL